MNMISRRMVKGLAAGLPLAVVLADPLLARVAAGGGLETVTIPAAGRKVSGSLALPAKAPAAAVLLIHEWWGLNDQIKSVAAEFARLGYVALALDMYAGKVGTIGWCFGGSLSLDASIATPVDATVVYYGRVDADEDRVVLVVEHAPDPREHGTRQRRGAEYRDQDRRAVLLLARQHFEARCGAATAHRVDVRHQRHILQERAERRVPDPEKRGDGIDQGDEAVALHAAW